MGKSKLKKDRKMARLSTTKKQNSSLNQQLIEDKSVRSISREKKRKIKFDEDYDKLMFVESRTSLKILKQAKEQIDELEDSKLIQEKRDEDGFNVNMLYKDQLILKKNNDNEDENDDNISEDYVDKYYNDDVDDNEIQELNEDLERKLTKFFPSSFNENVSTIADKLTEAISTKRTEIMTEDDCASITSTPSCLTEDVINLFRRVGKVMQTYRNGPVPKPLKIIPKYRNWEELLDLTEPDRWSAASVFAATRIFVSNLKDAQAARFMNKVLLPRIRDDIKEYKRLNDHLYEALIKCMFKSYGFMKGFLLPLCKDGTCTVREATIISSVLLKASIKMEHSAAAIMELCGLEYSPANCIFISCLVEKKYALPYVVVDELVNYFIRFRRSKDQLTVLWHQCLLTFVERCKRDISSEQKEGLLDLIKARPHPDISPLIRRELTGAQTRDFETSMDQ